MDRSTSAHSRLAMRLDACIDAAKIKSFKMDTPLVTLCVSVYCTAHVGSNVISYSCLFVRAKQCICYQLGPVQEVKTVTSRKFTG